VRVTSEKFDEIMSTGLIHKMTKAQMKDLEVEHDASDGIKIIISAENHPVLEINNIKVQLSEKSTEVIHDVLCKDIGGKKMRKQFMDILKYKDSEGEFGELDE